MTESQVVTSVTRPAPSRWKPAMLVCGEIGPIKGEVNLDVRWNGFACPRFDRIRVREIIRQLDTQNAYLRRLYDYSVGDLSVLVEVGDLFIEFSNIDDGTASVVEFEPDGDGMYHIGSFAWCWIEEGS